MTDQINCVTCILYRHSTCPSANMSTTACPLTEETLFDIENRENGFRSWKDLVKEDLDE